MTETRGPVFHIDPGGRLRGTVTIPGDKSISHRALMLGAITDGNCHLRGFLPGEDTLATQHALAAMGVTFESISATEIIVRGVGLHGLKSPDHALDLGNSGTSTRLFAGLLTGAGIDCEIIGDDSLMQRPMGRVIEPLQTMGADIQGSANQTLPIIIKRSKQLTGIHYSMPVASAQLKSCLLLAGLYAHSATCIKQPAPCRDHTERLLSALGADVITDNNIVCIQPVTSLHPTAINIPADISSATFFIVGALISPGSNLVLPGVGINPTRNAVLEILKSMGGNIELRNERNLSGEPVADLHVTASELRGIDIPEQLVPNAIDEFPAILVAAAAAHGTTRLTGAEELRVKESDRIVAIDEGLTHLGIQTRTFADGIQVTGGPMTGGRVNSFSDHRIAMAFAMAGLAASGPVIVEDCANVATSFPGFLELSQAAGLPIRGEDR